MKKVLIITYYWPPSGGGGVMRWLKMSKYLPELGWKPIIYTPSNPDSTVIDESLAAEIHPETEVIKTPIWEPYSIYRRITGAEKNTKFKAGYISEASSGNWKNKLSVFIRGNFLIPDPRKFWIRPSIKYLTKYLEENPVDLIVSTGPPHSMHLIALGLKKKFAIQWIADFRDPWTNIDFYDKLRLTEWADKKHKKLEQKVLKQADHVVTVSPSWQKDFERIGRRKVDLVHNGFDPVDFAIEDNVLEDKFTISHFGAFNKDRNPELLWKALSDLVSENEGFKESLRIQLIGQTDASVIDAIRKNNLVGHLKTIAYLPHNEGVKVLSRSHVLLLPINRAKNAMGILPGKMFEYLALQRPVFVVGPINSDSAKIITETKAGKVLGFNDKQGMKESLADYFKMYTENRLQIQPDSIEKFSRKNLAEKFMGLAEKVK